MKLLVIEFSMLWLAKLLEGILIFVPASKRFNGSFLISSSFISFTYSRPNFFGLVFAFLFFKILVGIQVAFILSSYNKDSYPDNKIALHAGHLFFESLNISDAHLSCII